ncbi:hypothetical protein ACO0LL_28525 [Undibacterium sp. TC4M20W]|uniref:hypothetical protein n=1 Tax=Undibacterium sp. TC4M20W TaxID=3413052 RepID=UPI003BF2151D
MNHQLKYSLALVQAIVCITLVGCGGSGESERATAAVVSPPPAPGSTTPPPEQIFQAARSELIAVDTTWTWVADENKQFTLSGSKTVRYGSGTSWVTKTISGTATCSNEFFGSDPLPHVGKRCEVAASTSLPLAPAAGTWVKIASQYQSVTLAAPQVVRYGHDTRWVEKQITSKTLYCSESSFDKDPAPGITKECQVFNAATGTSTGTASLAWSAPTINTDLSALTDLAGYRIYYGTTSGKYTKTIDLGASATSYVLKDLAPATYYFVLTAIDTSNNESAMSVEQNKVIN